MLRIYLWLYMFFLFAPIAIIILFAFHASASLVFPIDGLSLRWFDELFSSREFVTSLWNSLLVGFSTALLTTVLGSFGALALIRLPSFGRAVFTFATTSPIAFPGLFIGIALVILFAELGVERSLVTVTVAHILFALPFFVAAVRSRVEYFDTSLEEAARDLGATAAQSFWLVTLPIIAPTITGAAILTFALSFDEFIITVFVSGNDTTLPLFIWSMLRRTVSPAINAASVVALGLSLVVLIIGGVAFWLQRRRAIAGRTEEA
jgi:spermidine/putrescine transport system permease protein